MAQELTDGEFWLPPEFLNDEDILMGFTNIKPKSEASTVGLNKGSSGSYGSGYNPNSDLSSPVESGLGSPETESDEEDYPNGLNRKFANNLKFENTHTKSARVMAGSPQSTLCGCKNGSSRGSPNCLSPPSLVAEANQNRPSLDVLYAAVGEVARMRLIEEATSRYYNHNKNQSTRNVANPNLDYRQLQVAQFHLLKQQQLAKHQYFQMMLQKARHAGGNVRSVAPPLSAWPTPQQAQQQPPPQRKPGSGMRAVFLGNPSIKRESNGTGVFLPRQPGAPTEPLKKRGCSTVLLPDRVVQALDLKLETMGAESKIHPLCNGGSLVSDYDAEIMYRKSVIGQQRRNNHRQPPAALAELRLPQEWTY